MKKERNYAKKVGVEFFENTMILGDIIKLTEKRKLSYQIVTRAIIVFMGNEISAVWEFHGYGNNQLAFFMHRWNESTKTKDSKVWMLNRI